jgi:hypothetical protein
MEITELNVLADKVADILDKRESDSRSTLETVGAVTVLLGVGFVAVKLVQGEIAKRRLLKMWRREK